MSEQVTTYDVTGQWAQCGRRAHDQVVEVGWSAAPADMSESIQVTVKRGGAPQPGGALDPNHTAELARGTDPGWLFVSNPTPPLEDEVWARVTTASVTRKIRIKLSSE